MLPIVAVQISPGAPAPALEERLLSACSAGLARARCVAARDLSAGSLSAGGGGQEPRAVAMVSFLGPQRVAIEVGLSNGGEPEWISREIAFADADPQLERWRAVGFTIASLADDRRFWAEPSPAVTLSELPAARSAGAAERELWEVDARALGGTGMVGGVPRLGAELRVIAPLSTAFFATGSLGYAFADEDSYAVRWFDGSLGLGLDLGDLLRDVGARLRLEALAENVAVSAERGARGDRRSAWVPGASLGVDLSWRLAVSWVLSAGADAFWLDGGTAVRAEGERLGASAGAGARLSFGAGYTF